MKKRLLIAKIPKFLSPVKLALALFFTALVMTRLCCAETGIDIGDKSVDFTLKEISSPATFKLSNYEGKSAVLVNFFATWCPYCTQEIPDLHKIQKEFGDKGLVIASVNVQESEGKVANFVRKKKIMYKVLLDSDADVSKKFKVYGIPTNILIDSKGTIVFRGNSLPEIEDIEKSLPKKKTKKAKK